MTSACLRCGLLTLAALALGGCIGFYGYRTFETTVLDAETGKPIAGARVDVRYECMGVSNPPQRFGAFTDVNGKVELKVAEPQRCRTIFAVSATEYIPEEWPIQADVLRLYREPMPRLVIVVPREFRGAFTLVWHRSEQWSQKEPGKRDFRVVLQPGEAIHLEESPLWWRNKFWRSGAISVQADGRAIPGEGAVGESEIALRGPIKGDSDRRDETRETYLVGTREEYLKERKRER